MFTYPPDAHDLFSCLVEYWRNRYQRMNVERFFAANTIALLTHTLVGKLTLLTILHRFRHNRLILSKFDLKCFKKEKCTQELHSNEVSTASIYSMKFESKVAVSEDSTLHLIHSLSERRPILRRESGHSLSSTIT